MIRSWMWLFLAIVFEVAGTISMKFSAGFTHVIPSILVFIFYGICLVFLTLALKSIDVSIAYAIWSALGTVLVITAGIAWFKEPLTFIKAVGIFLIITGVVMLNLSDKAGV